MDLSLNRLYSELSFHFDSNRFEKSTVSYDGITYDLYDFLGVAVPEMSYSNVSINGQEWGLYLALEVIDER